LIKEKYFNNDCRDTYNHCVESIIKEVFSWVSKLEVNYSIKKFHRTNSYSFISDGFWFNICEFPRISIIASYTKASEIILTGYATNDFVKDYCDGIKRHLDNRQTKITANLYSLLYTLEKYPFTNKPLVLDIANEILNLEIKHKTQVIR
jgi:hypothetical protein